MSPSSQDEVVGDRFTLLLKQPTKQKIYETTVSMTRDVRQQRTVIPDGQDTNEVSPVIA